MQVLPGAGQQVEVAPPKRDHVDWLDGPDGGAPALVPQQPELAERVARAQPSQWTLLAVLLAHHLHGAAHDDVERVRKLALA